MRTRAKDALPIEPDRLAATVIGALRYLPPAIWLRPFLNALSHWNPRLSLDWEASDDVEVELWPCFLVPSSLVRHLGMLPRQRGGRRLTKGFISPDAVVSCADWTLVVSVQGDEEIPAERLFQDYVLARSLRDDDRFAVVHIDTSGTRRLRAGVRFRAPRRGDRDVLAEDPLARYVAVRAERIDGIAIDEAFAEARLAWLSWSTLHTLLAGLELDDDADPDLRGVVERVRRDALSLLEESELVAPSYDIAELAALSIDAESLPTFDEREASPEAPVAAATYAPGDAEPAPRAAEADDAVEAEANDAGEAEVPDEVEARSSGASREQPEQATATDDEADAPGVAESDATRRGISFDTGGGASKQWRRAPAVSSADYAPSKRPGPKPADEPADEPEESALIAFAGLVDDLSALSIDPNAIPYYPRPRGQEIV